MPVTALRRGHVTFELIVEVKEPAKTFPLNDEVVERRKDPSLFRFNTIRHVFQRSCERVGSLVPVCHLHGPPASLFDSMGESFANSRRDGSISQIAKLWFAGQAVGLKRAFDEKI